MGVRRKPDRPIEKGAHTAPTVQGRQDWFCSDFYAKVLSTVGERMQGWDRRPGALQIFGRAFSSNWRFVISVPWLLPGAIIAYALVSFGAARLSDHFPVNMAEEFRRTNINALHNVAYSKVVPLQILHLVTSFLTTFIDAVPCVLISRHVLLDETGFRAPPIAILWRYTAWGFAISTVTFALGQLRYFFADWWLFVLPTLVSFTLLMLFSLVYPGLAVGARHDSAWGRLCSGVRHLRGNFWLLLRVCLIIFMIDMIAGAFLYLPVFLYPQSPFNIITSPTGLAVLSLRAATLVILNCIGIAAMAWLYAWAVPSSQWLDNFD